MAVIDRSVTSQLRVARPQAAPVAASPMQGLADGLGQVAGAVVEVQDERQAALERIALVRASGAYELSLRDLESEDERQAGPAGHGLFNDNTIAARDEAWSQAIAEHAPMLSELGKARAEELRALADQGSDDRLAATEDRLQLDFIRAGVDEAINLATANLEDDLEGWNDHRAAAMRAIRELPPDERDVKTAELDRQMLHGSLRALTAQGEYDRAAAVLRASSGRLTANERDSFENYIQVRRDRADRQAAAMASLSAAERFDMLYDQAVNGGELDLAHLSRLPQAQRETLVNIQQGLPITSDPSAYLEFDDNYLRHGGAWVVEQDMGEWAQRLHPDSNEYKLVRQIYDEELAKVIDRAAPQGDGRAVTTAQDNTYIRNALIASLPGFTYGEDASPDHAALFNAVHSFANQRIASVPEGEMTLEKRQAILDEATAVAIIDGRRVPAAPGAAVDTGFIGPAALGLRDNRAAEQFSVGVIPEEHVEAVAAIFAGDNVDLSRAETTYRGAMTILEETGEPATRENLIMIMGVLEEQRLAHRSRSIENVRADLFNLIPGDEE